MAKQISVALQDHLTGAATTLTTCWQIIRLDGAAFYLTDFDQPLVIDGITYTSSAGYSRTAMAHAADMTISNLDVQGVFDSESLTEADLRAGLFDYAKFFVFIVNLSDLSQGILRMKRGTFGEVSCSPSGIFVVELRGMTQQMAQNIGNIVSADCNADLGDTRCRVPIAPPVVQRNTVYQVGTIVSNTVSTGPLGSTTIYTTSQQYRDLIFECTTAGTTAADPHYYGLTGVSTDGTAQFTPHPAWTRSGVVAADCTDGLTVAVNLDQVESRAASGWFNYGALLFDTGLNAGRVIEINTHQHNADGSHTVVLELSLPYPIVAGNRIQIYPGCSKTKATCSSKFNNVINMRGFPDVPGNDLLSAYSNAQ